MLGRFWEFTKRHPWLIGGGVLGLVVLIWLMTRGGGKSEGSGVYATTADPNIVAAEAQKSIAQNQLNAAVSLAGIGAKRDVDLATLQSGVQQNYLTTLTTISQKQFDTALKIRETEVTGMTRLADIESAAAQALGNLGNIRARESNQTSITLARMHEATAQARDRASIAAAERVSNRQMLTDAAGRVADAQRAAYFPGGWQWGNPLGNDAFQDLLRRFG